MRIAEAASKCGLSIDTIRYYERTNLLPPVHRTADGHRRFGPEDIEWLTLLASLRDTRMPMKQMRRFARLYRDGDSSIAERKSMLLEHSEHLARQREVLDRCAELLAFKLERYETVLEAPS